MAEVYPLLIFPQPRSIEPPKGQGFPPTPLQLPSHSRQIDRVEPLISSIEYEFQRFRGRVESSMSGLEPEMVLVIELADRIDDLARAVNAIGLEWLAEWDTLLEEDEDFPASSSRSTRKGRLFVSLVNQGSLNELLSLWSKWKRGIVLPHRKRKWRDIFKCLRDIRRWGIQETLIETGMKDYFAALSPDESVSFQIECFYHRSSSKRREIQEKIFSFLAQDDGELVSEFIEMPDIAFHAVKARMPVKNISRILDESDNLEEHLSLFTYPHIMYFRRSGQLITKSAKGDGLDADYPIAEARSNPVAAVLDGVPNLRHKALDGYVNFDDPFDLADEYQPGERQHGTAMASLVIHGDRSDTTAGPLNSTLHHIAVMQVDSQSRGFDGLIVEHFPESCFCEDRIEQAVRRIFESDDETEAQAPNVKIINLSLGDPTRPFLHNVSPWARLLDWLSWKYRVLFCVSAGNYLDSYDLGIAYDKYRTKTELQKSTLLLKHLQHTLFDRRLLAPAESINALTVGARHHDESGDIDYGSRLELDPNGKLPSPISRIGHGFRRSVKPEIYLPGGRQLYHAPVLDADSEFKIDEFIGRPGQKVAWDSSQEGEVSRDTYHRGTSNATALATRAGVQIHEVLRTIQNDDQNNIPDNLVSVVIKALLVHGCVQERESQRVLEFLRDSNSSVPFKTILARYLGYGSLNVDRVLACTEQRGTAIGFGEVKPDKIHEFRFPVPDDFGGQAVFRRMIVTLAWFSPINAMHRYLREAKLEIKPGVKWDESPLKVNRTDGDHNQVKRGTVQHEVLEGRDSIGQFHQDEEIVLRVVCKKDATHSLEEAIPYGLAVTLEASEISHIPVYEKVRQRLSEQIQIVETQ